MNARSDPSSQVRNLLTVLAVLFFWVLALSYYLDLTATRQRYEELARAVARSIFQQFVVIRQWTTQHDGVYVALSDHLIVDPNFKHLSGDVKTTEGVVLTRIHPEYITRLISDILTREKGIKVDVTSLKLASKMNEADPWEKGALEKFGKGSIEEFAVVGRGQSASFRYIAPLRMEEPCLRCHGSQGYKIGDIRGGLSISLPFASFRAAATRSYTQGLVIHLLFLVLGLAIVYVLGKNLMKRVVELQEASSRIRRLEGILPICANCKKIRAPGADPKKQDSWTPVELFIRDRTDAEFTHGFCPECLKELYNWPNDK
jgi:two-component system, NtrC family, sensor kinase